MNVNYVWYEIFNVFSVLDKFKLFGISKEIERARICNIKTNFKRYCCEITTREAIVLLKGLCILQFNEEFVLLFKMHPLFKCSQGIHWRGYWPSDGCCQEYAYFLCFYHQNEELLEMLKVKDLFRSGNGDAMFAYFYAAGCRGDLEDLKVADLRKKLDVEGDCLYDNFLDGLLHGGNFTELAQELLSEKARYWLVFEDVESYLEWPKHPCSFKEDKKVLKRFGLNENQRWNLLDNLVFKTLWFEITEIAKNFLEEKTNWKFIKLVNEMFGDFRVSILGIKEFPDVMEGFHRKCEHS